MIGYAGAPRRAAWLVSWEPRTRRRSPWPAGGSGGGRPGPARAGGARPAGPAGPHLTPGTVVTDVASTKRCVEAWAARFLPLGVAFIGGHPMAGKEQAGIEHADGRLFRGRTWCIVPPPGADPGAEEVVRRLAEDAGSHTVRLGALLSTTAPWQPPATSPSSPRPSWPRRWSPGPSSPTWPQVAGRRLRDTTRLADGDPLMHRDICLTNRDFLVREVERFAAHLAPRPTSCAGSPIRTTSHRPRRRERTRCRSGSHLRRPQGGPRRLAGWVAGHVRRRPAGLDRSCYTGTQANRETRLRRGRLPAQAPAQRWPATGCEPATGVPTAKTTPEPARDARPPPV